VLLGSFSGFMLGFGAGGGVPDRPVPQMPSVMPEGMR